jgi:hypothetical protein
MEMRPLLNLDPAACPPTDKPMSQCYYLFKQHSTGLLVVDPSISMCWFGGPELRITHCRIHF